MSYGAVCDSFHSHPKTLELVAMRGGHRSLSLWVRALSYASDHGTDGRVSRAVTRALGYSSSDARRLVAVSLWVEDGDGWRFHEWDIHNPTADEIAAKKAKRNAKQRRRRRKKAGLLDRNVDGLQDGLDGGPSRARVPPTPTPTPLNSRGVVHDREPDRAREAGGYDDDDHRSLARSEVEIRDARRALRLAWAAAWSKRTASDPPPAQLEEVGRLAGWLVEYARRGDLAPPDLAQRLVGAFFAAKRGRPPVSWLAEDPGRYLDPDAAAGRAATSARRRAEYDAAVKRRQEARRAELEAIAREVDLAAAAKRRKRDDDPTAPSHIAAALEITS